MDCKGMLRRWGSLISFFFILYFLIWELPTHTKTSHYLNKERSIITKIHFAYYYQYTNGIDIVFADNTLLFLFYEGAEKNLQTTPNYQRLIDNLTIDDLLKYIILALDCELQV